MKLLSCHGIMQVDKECNSLNIKFEEELSKVEEENDPLEVMENNDLQEFNNDDLEAKDSPLISG